MRLARIRGYVTATAKHPSFTGCRLLVAQPVGPDDRAEGDPQVVVDELGCALHQKVVISSDGGYVREFLGNPRSPARYWVAAIIDPAPDATTP